MADTVFGIVTEQHQASTIVSRLKSAGFVDNDISVLFHNKQGTRNFAHEHNTKAPEGATVGATAGGVAGGALGLLAGLGALAIPGVGPLIAAGPILAALSGGALGAGVGGIVGGLVGMGIPEFEAKVYEGKLRKGNILLSAHAADRERMDIARTIFQEEGATDISTGGETHVPERERDTDGMGMHR